MKKKILVLAHHGIGDVVMSLPFMYVLKKHHRDAKIYVTLKSDAEFKILSNSYVWDDKMIEPLILQNRSYLGLLKCLNHHKFDKCISLFINPLKSLLLFYLIPCRKIYGVHPYITAKRWWMRLYDAFVYNPCRMHKIELTLRLAEKMDMAASDKLLEDTKWLNFTYSGLIPEPYIVIHPGSGVIEKHKRWPKEYYIELIRLLLDSSYNGKIVLVGREEECADCLDIISSVGKGDRRIINLCDKCDINQLGSVISGAELVIGSDSGVLHVAAALGKPVISIFGPTDWRVTSPYSEKVIKLRSTMSCSPCYGRNIRGCGNPLCMREVKPGAVFEHVLQLISLGGKPQ